MPEYKFLMTVTIPDAHDNADDAEWWWDAAQRALREYGATEPALPHFKPAHAVLNWDDDNIITPG